MTAARKKHIKTEYEIQRENYRNASHRHVVTFEASMSENQKRHTFATNDEARQLGNIVRGTMKKRLEQMKRTKAYRKLMADYAYCITRMGRVKKDSDEYKELVKRKSGIGKEMSAVQKEFKITKDDVRQEMIRVSKESGVSSVFLLKEAESVWQSLEKILFSNGKNIHFHKRGDLPCLRAKQSNKCIIIRAIDGKLRFSIDGKIGDFGIITPQKDTFLVDELSRILKFLENPAVIEKNVVEAYAKHGIILDTYRPCYASLKCEIIRGRLRVFVQVTVEGKACPKVRKDGSPRHDFSKKGPVGADIGTQSVAASSQYGILLENLGERNNKSTKESEALERRLLRKMDRSRRACNPDNYNEDGTVKPRKQRHPWEKSKTYLKTLEEYRDICRKNALNRKYANQELANRIREMGDVLITEPKNAERLKHKTKEAKFTVRADGTKKYSSRHRFGRSVQHRSPGGLQQDLKNMFGEDKYYEVPNSYKASQYDHTANEFIKKELNQRMFQLQDGTTVQRDVYSAYLLCHPNSEMKAPDHDACVADFAAFKKEMDALIAEIKASGKKICNSGIKVSTPAAPKAADKIQNTVTN